MVFNHLPSDPFALKCKINPIDQDGTAGIFRTFYVLIFAQPNQDFIIVQLLRFKFKKHRTTIRVFEQGQCSGGSFNELMSMIEINRIKKRRGLDKVRSVAGWNAVKVIRPQKNFE